MVDSEAGGAGSGIAKAGEVGLSLGQGSSRNSPVEPVSVFDKYFDVNHPF